MIEILVVLAVLMTLYVVAFGAEAVSLGEVVLWVVGGLVLAFVAARLLTAKVAEALMGGGKRRASGQTAAGLSQLRRGELAAAEQLLRQSLKRNPADIEAAQGLAEIARRGGEGERYMQITSQILAQRDALRPGEWVTLCHRQADVCLEDLHDPKRAVEALARIELDAPGTAAAVRARERIERILSVEAANAREN